MDYWKELIKKHAGDRKICNCGWAYLTPCGEGYVRGVKKNDILVCESGCSANQIKARDYIAEQLWQTTIK
jgi:hypothetical protein